MSRSEYRSVTRAWKWGTKNDTWPATRSGPALFDEKSSQVSVRWSKQKYKAIKACRLGNCHESVGDFPADHERKMNSTCEYRGITVIVCFYSLHQ